MRQRFCAMLFCVASVVACGDEVSPPSVECGGRSDGEACGCAQSGVWHCSDAGGRCEGANDVLCVGCDPQAVGLPCGVCGATDCVNQEEVCIDDGSNACGGCAALGANPGDLCGECGQGMWVCDGADAVSCTGDEARNACGGCEGLPALPGSSCGECAAGEWACNGAEAVTCMESGEALNTCGGCSTLDETVGSPCEREGSGCGAQWACMGPDALFCDDSVSTPRNACGGCVELTGAPGESCGPCATLMCDGPDSLICDGQCILGVSCESASQCASGLDCTAGRCAPPGLAFISAGTFLMGAPLNEPGRHTLRENGQHTVTLTRDLLVQRTEVTQGDYQTVVGSNPSFFQSCGATCPVENLSWWEMLLYANALSTREGLTPCYNDLGICTGTEGGGCAGMDHCIGFTCANATPTFSLDCDGYRLPTESEWEYFARAGTSTAFITPSGSIVHWDATPLDPELDVIAWYGGNSGVTYAGGKMCDYNPSATTCGPHPAGNKAPNAWGLYDITGNVWERVWDRVGDYPTPGSSVTDPLGPGPSAGRSRRMRGGPFDAWGQYMRVAYRTGPAPEARWYNIGFRLVRSLPPSL